MILDFINGLSTAELWGQVLAIASTVLMFTSYQLNSKEGVLIVLSAFTFCITLSYFLLGQMTGAALNVICFTRNMCYYFMKEGTKLYYGTSIALTVALGIVGAITWDGFPSLLIIVALMINTLVLSLGDAQKLRWSIILTSSMILVYNAIIVSIGGMANESLAVVSSIIGIIRYRKVATS